MPFPRARRKAALAVIAAAVLSACSPVPPSTIAALHAFDLSTVAAGDLRLAVRVPAAFVLDGGAPTLTITVAVAAGAPTVRTYTMAETPAPPELAAGAQSGTELRAYALDPRSAAELDAYLAELRHTAAPGSRQLALGLGVEGCRSDGGSGRLEVTTFIQLAPTEPFLVLTRPRDVATLAAMAGAEDATVPPCT
ncbi:MAG: hypothetical protein IT534_07215 [Bauldia sp.]|nr:hypothetical protein [Bauldia sp.]